MSQAPHRVPWRAVVGLVTVIAIIAVASCQSARRFKPPYHEPAATPKIRD